MLIVPQHLLAEFSTILTSETRLTDEQLAVLKDEITNDPTGRGYKNMAVADICVCLSNPYSIRNVEQPELIAKESTHKNDLYNYLAKNWAEDGIPYWYKIETAAKRQDQLGIACAMIVSTVSHLEEITLGTAQVKQYEQILVSSGIISQDKADAILKQPDPNYVASVQMPSRLEAIGFGAGAVLTMGDLEAVLG